MIWMASKNETMVIRVGLAIVAGLCCLIGSAHADDLFVHDDSAKFDKGLTLIDPSIRRQTFVSLNADLLTVNGSTKSYPKTRLKLFDDVVLIADLTRNKALSSDADTYFGAVEGVDDSQVSLVSKGGVLVGNIRLPRCAIHRALQWGSDVSHCRNKSGDISAWVPTYRPRSLGRWARTLRKNV